MYRKAIMVLSLLGMVFIGIVDAQADPIRDQLIDRVRQPLNRILAMCEWSAQFHFLVPQAQLPTTCAELRKEGEKALAKAKTVEDLNVLSSAVDHFEINIAPPLRDMEIAYTKLRQLIPNVGPPVTVPQLTEQERLGKFVRTERDMEIMRK